MLNHPLRRMGAAILSLALALSIAVVPAAATTGAQQIQASYSDIKVMLDDEFLVLTDANGKTVEPFSLNGTTYLPVRAVAGALGLSADWDAATHTVALTSGGAKTTATTTSPAKGRTITIGLTADYMDIKVTLDGKPLALTDANGKTVEPFAIEGTTYLPIRAISNALGLEVGWNGEYHVVTLSTDPFTITADDATLLVQGWMDKVYSGKLNVEYMDLVGITADEFYAGFLYNVQMESDFFCYYWNIVDPDQGESFEALDPEVRNLVQDLIKSVYAKSKYTVSPATPIAGTDNFEVKVTVEPINVMDQADAAYSSAITAFNAKYPDKMTDAEYVVYVKEYAKMVVGLVQTAMANQGYLAPQEVVVHVEKDADATFGPRTDDLDAIDNLIIHYPS